MVKLDAQDLGQVRDDDARSVLLVRVHSQRVRQVRAAAQGATQVGQNALGVSLVMVH